MSNRTVRRAFMLAAFVSLVATVVDAGPSGRRDRSNDRRITAGSAHTCVVRDDGHIQCWGWNGLGQLGDNTHNDRTVPGEAVVGLSPAINRPADALAVTAGAVHTCALRLDTIACWGDNISGQIGDNTRTERTRAVHLAVSGAIGLALGIDHTCALLQTGQVRCWGDNTFGQLGTGNNTAQIRATTATNVSNLTDAIAITGGVFHTCALRANGNVVCWGLNDEGQLGNGTTGNSNVPVAVNLTQLVDISAGYGHTCALRADGTLRCWGRNAEGQLGNRSFVPSLGPTTVNNMANVKALSAGWFHTCAVRADATTSCWGDNSSGQIGDGTFTNRDRPTSVQNLLVDVVTIAAGNTHTCALRVNGSMSCWGFNDSGQLGGAPLGQVSVASDVQVVTGRSPAISIDGSGSGFGAAGHTCALRASGGVACWGINFNGEITGTDDANVFTVTEATGPPAVAAGITAVEGGFGHTCALTVTGTVVCWGGNRSGQIGNGEESGDPVPPTTVPGLDQVVALAAGFESTCALRADGTVQCWGRGSLGQLGNGTEDRATPAEVVGLTNVKAITGGATHYCAIRGNGRVRCWGSNASGQLGNGATASSVADHVGVNNLSDARTIGAGFSHTCAIRATGNVVCWGSNAAGQLGTGGTAVSVPQPTPLVAQVRTNLQTVVQQTVVARDIGLGGQVSCVVTDTRTLCWGGNSRLQVGQDNLPNSTVHLIPTVVQLPSGEPLSRGRSSVTGENDSMCALRPDGVPFCWGSVKQDSIFDPTSRPVEVASFRVNILPRASFAGGSQNVNVTVVANCLAGQHVQIEVQVEQGAARGSGHSAGRCQDGLAEYPVTVAAHGQPSFVAGPAAAVATVVIRETGQIVDTQTWNRSITIVP